MREQVGEDTDPVEQAQLIALRDRAIQRTREALESDVADLQMTLTEDGEDRDKLGNAPQVE